MSGRLSDAWLEELRSRVSLEEVVSEYVPLKQKGRRYWGCCPFHNEKTPSFAVNSDTQLYYCFGCHKGGTVIHFVMEMERMEFMDAVRYLADRAHMDVPEVASQPSEARASRDERERMYEANRDAARYFHGLLWTGEGADALNYLYSRGLNDSDIRHFGLGASPRERDGLRAGLHILVGGNAVKDVSPRLLGADGKSETALDSLRLCHEFMALRAGGAR